MTDYILTHFDQKTYRGDKTYTFNVLQNVADVASASGKATIEEIKQKQRISGFNSIFAVSSVDAAKLYYAEFKRQMAENPQRRLKVALIYSYGANEAETDGILNIVGINGQIVFESITQNYDALLKEFDDGTKNCQDIGNVIYKVHK